VKDNIKGIGFQHKLTFLFVILLITFMIFGYAQYSINKQLNETSHWVTHTHNVIAKARLLIKLLVDMETGERGFLIVGQEEFLEPYNKGKLKFNRDLGQLKRIVSDNFSQVSLLDETQRLAEQWHIQVWPHLFRSESLYNLWEHLSVQYDHFPRRTAPLPPHRRHKRFWNDYGHSGCSFL